MYETDYKDLLNIKSRFSDGLIDNYYLCLTILPEEVHNPYWVSFIGFMKMLKPKCVYKVFNVVPYGEFDNVRVDTVFDDFIPTDKIPEVVAMIEALDKFIPKGKIRISFEWKCSAFE